MKKRTGLTVKENNILMGKYRYIGEVLSSVTYLFDLVYHLAYTKPYIHFKTLLKLFVKH